MATIKDQPDGRQGYRHNANPDTPDEGMLKEDIKVEDIGGIPPTPPPPTDPPMKELKFPRPSPQMFFNVAIAIAIACAFMYANDERTPAQTQQTKVNLTKIDNEFRKDIRLLDRRTWWLRDQISNNRAEIREVAHDLDVLTDEVADLKFNRATLLRLSNELIDGPKRFILKLMQPNQQVRLD